MAIPGKKHIGILFTLLILTSVFAGMGVQRSVLAYDDIQQTYEKIKILTNILFTIQENYVDSDKTKTEDLLNEAIHGMVNGLDRYSVYFEADEAKEFNDQTQGSFGGLGVQIDMMNGWLTVVEPLPNTPAAKAGLISRDRIVEIEGESTKGVNIYEIMKKLKGEPGTAVTVTIARQGETELIEKTIVRAVIHTSAVENDEKKMLDKTIGYIRLRDFTRDAAEELEVAIRDLQGQGMTALILDLRDNVGGLLDVAVSVSDLFIEKGKVIVYHRDSSGYEKIYKANKEPLGNFLLAVLVNELTASASEIVAGAVQDHKRGILVGPAGHKTLGKGSVQTVFELKNPRGASLKLTTAKYYTPLGRSTQDEKGFTPDLFAQVTLEQRIQINRAGKYGHIPPELLGLTKKESEEKEPEHPITVEDVFKETEEKDSVYDIELFTAYQCLKGVTVLQP